MQIHALWCHPRSVSTAFERIMRARGDLQVFHEPFMYHHYLTQTDRPFPDFEPEPDHPRTYADIRAMILDAARAQPVFFKDMAYYILKELPEDDAFRDAMSHAFLLRDPAEAILSYHKRDPDFACSELGIDAQYHLYQALCERGHDPVVITADQLRLAPETTLRRYWDHVGLPFLAHAFEWDSEVPKGWESVVSWHSDVLSRGAIQAHDTTRDLQGELAALGERFVGYDRHHRPFYDKMQDIAERQAHQK
jgi:hypothetical protein